MNQADVFPSVQDCLVQPFHTPALGQIKKRRCTGSSEAPHQGAHTGQPQLLTNTWIMAANGASSDATLGVPPPY
ncbi:hypothetical protein [Streptomyces sp. SAI-041]|uniref:hypothetical protein n=1 Tax=Streptomyces sp. SAI-041 TaxID=2940548 RepID=UPI0024732254|nr:hypothetical protein [Streptomyces sp. SAI-041]MDH6554834.1 hypothetical protein [Streptomyces sp. SAI-041]